jgi:hypothetical protein
MRVGTTREPVSGEPHRKLSHLERARRIDEVGEIANEMRITLSSVSFSEFLSSHSHSIVPGGFEVMSYTTRLTPFTSLTMRVATWPMNFMSKG